MARRGDPSAVTMGPVAVRAVVGLSGIYAFRMLGLFMILPVFTLYGPEIPGYTPALAGLAIGIYGLTQATLQIPFGFLSDRIGRRPVIAFGLAMFALGSLLAGTADTMTEIIAGRALQGAGAISAAVLALAADLTPEEHRTKAMATIGMTIGMAFFASLILGPVIGARYGLSGIFWLTAAFGVIGLVILFLYVPAPRTSSVHMEAEAVPALIGRVLRDGRLLRLDAGILILHAIMTASFVALPPMLEAHMAGADHWMLYLVVLLLSVVIMVPFVILAEKHRRMRPVFVGAVAVMGLAQLGFYASGGSLAGLAVTLVIYFAAVNVLEAALPSLVSRVAPAQSKGTAMGVYSTAQFLGAFLGGVLGGLILGAGGTSQVFLLGVALAGLWLLLALTMRFPRHLSSRLLSVGRLPKAEAGELARRLGGVPGVAEAVVLGEEGIAYLKVDGRQLDEEALARATGHG